MTRWWVFMVNGHPGHPNTAMTRKARQLSAQGEGGVQLVGCGITAVPQPSLWLLIKMPLSSLSRKRPFFTNKKNTFAKLSRTPCLSIYSHPIYCSPWIVVVVCNPGVSWCEVCKST